MDDTLKLISINCQGLHTVEKRKDVFNYLRAKHCAVYLLQDTHFTKDQDIIIRSQWGVGEGLRDCYCNSFKINSRGMAILFNNTKTNVIVHNQISSIHGNVLALYLSLNKQRFTLVNIYGPSDRDTPFFFLFFQQLE